MFASIFKAAPGAMGAVLLMAHAGHAQVRPVDKNEFLIVVQAHMMTGNYVEREEPSLMGHFFSTGDVDRFIAAVDGWLKGVVVDPGYLDETQGEGVPGFTQPSGWTGFSQSLVQSLENKYNGFIILAEFNPNDAQSVVTASHEAIHAYAQATGNTALDSDDDGGPEYLSGAFITELMPALQALDLKYFGPSFKAAWDCRYDDVARFKSAWLTALAEKRYIYDNYRTHNGATAKALIESWGGKLDWDGFETYIATIDDGDTKDDCN